MSLRRKIALWLCPELRDQMDLGIELHHISEKLNLVFKDEACAREVSSSRRAALSEAQVARVPLT